MNKLNILALLAGALRRCRSLAGNGHAARPAPCLASRQHAHILSNLFMNRPLPLRSGCFLPDSRLFADNQLQSQGRQQAEQAFHTAFFRLLFKR